MRKFMSEIGFKACKADPKVWMRAATTNDGLEYWEYILLYVNDCLVLSHRGEEILREEIGAHFKLKPSSIGPPNIYLGGKVPCKLYETMEGLKHCWSFSSSQYVKAVCDNVANYLGNEGCKRPGFKFPKPRDAPISNGCRPELDESEELNDNNANHYQSLIGILRWIVELGRVDIITEVSMLASCLAMPRYGHLMELFNIFTYLRKHHNTEMVFDPSTPYINIEDDFPKQDWLTSVYLNDGVTSEEIPTDSPTAKGKSMIMRLFVDSDHAGDKVTHRSWTGYLVFLKNSPITGFSKKQTSVETSTFGSKFIAMKTATEYI